MADFLLKKLLKQILSLNFLIKYFAVDRGSFGGLVTGGHFLYTCIYRRVAGLGCFFELSNI